MKITITYLLSASLLLLSTGCSKEPNGMYVSEADDSFFVFFENGYITTNTLSGDSSIVRYKREGLTVYTRELQKGERPLVLGYETKSDEVLLKPWIFKKSHRTLDSSE